MGRKHMRGLVNRAGIWHIDKRIRGRRICQSTGSTELQEAERQLARVMEVRRQAEVYGVRPSRTFEEAAAKFVLENQHKRTLGDDIRMLKRFMPWIGNVAIDKLHMGVLQPWIANRRSAAIAVGTINNGLQIVRRILNLAAHEWVDEQGLTWLQVPAKIKLLPNPMRRQPYPLNWDEQSQLFAEVPPHLADMALFAANTGCRASKICALRWDWEIDVPQLGTSVFLVGRQSEKWRRTLGFLNPIARSVIDSNRGQHPVRVFTYDGRPVNSMLNSAWKKARCRVGLPMVRVHDLKHTFGRRLRAAGVSFEDRQDLLGHRSGRITTHYSAAELSKLIEAAEKVVDQNGQRPELVILRGRWGTNSRETPAKAAVGIRADGKNR